ncbi:NACHT domain-containing protein [Actinocrispum wychmicini]|uniref:NACHT domain-containing protein n=1 Tax=Actinocrispum wychmicini TaxID=1213861 RepID=A0A4R2JQK4_9PSEU|nr:NACHT domain-containing protein [Actinocrispum wychmicini]
MTQEVLAERSDLSVRTIRRLETGQSANPQVETVRLLADALRLKPDERAQLLAVAAGQTPPDPPSDNGIPLVSSFERGLAEATDDLAHAVRARWEREEELRRIQDPFPLPVRWQLAPDDVMDHWANICRAAPGESATPLDLAGHLPEIADFYGRIPSGRLVVLGRAGSGKSVLAGRFVLDMLRTRPRAGAVPVVFSLGSWNPTTTGFRDWLAGRLVRDHPGLSATGRDGSTLACALVEAGRILPVLDGFDELAEGLHRAALDALNATTLPLLLTSRPGEYATVARSDALTAAAAVSLTDLTVSDLVNYLPRTSGATGWEPVLNELRDHPEHPASVNLRAVLTTPLMIGLARAIYSDPAGHDPQELLDTDRFDGQYALEDHLLSSFIPTVYRDQPGRRRWDPDGVQRWLRYLARHLNRLGTRDLTWWQLGSTMRPLRRLFVVGLVAGVAFAFAAGLVATLMGGLGFETEAADAFTAGPLDGLAAALAVGLARGVGLAFGGAAIKPFRVQMRLHGGERRLGVRFIRRFMVGVTVGLALAGGLGLAGVLGIHFWIVGKLGPGPWYGVLAGLVIGPLIGLVWGLMARFEAPLDVRTAVNPTDLLTTNRATVIFQSVVLGLVSAVAYGVMAGLMHGARYGLLHGVSYGLVLGLAVGLGVTLSLTAWGQWLALARIWLPLHRRLPWALIAFLDDACQRGVLRHVGAVYQFRHARLHDHLTG